MLKQQGYDSNLKHDMISTGHIVIGRSSKFVYIPKGEIILKYWLKLSQLKHGPQQNMLKYKF